MSKGSLRGGLSAGLLVLSVLVSGCGTASPGAPSALDPARMAPAGSLIYVSLTVRPQGAQRTQIEAALHKLFGNQSDQSIRRAVDKMLHKQGSSYGADVQPWLGQRIGVVVTRFSATAQGTAAQAGVAVISPTRKPSAARAYIESLVKRNPGTTGGVVNGYAVYGGQLAYQEILATNAGNSLAATQGYQATTAQLGSDTAATVYVNLSRFDHVLASRSALSGVPAQQLKRFLARVGPGAGIAAGLTLSPTAIRYDTVAAGLRPGPARHGTPADVGGLPSQAWLALDTGGNFMAGGSKQMGAGMELGALGALQSQAAGNPTAAGMLQRLALLSRYLPALGPLSLAVGGTSPLNLSAGLALRPGSMSAAGRLLRLLRGVLARNPAFNVTGGAKHFSLGLPTGSRLIVNAGRGRVVATYGYPNQLSYLRPSSPLADDPTYRQAAAQLPPSSSIPLYVLIPPLAGLVQLADHQRSAGQLVATLDKLSYVIAGGHAGHDRVVIGLR